MEPEKTLDSQGHHDQKEQFWKDYHPTIQDILYSNINKKYHTITEMNLLITGTKFKT